MEKEYQISWLKVIGFFVLFVVIIGILCIIYPKNKSNATITASNFNSNINLMKEAGFEYFQGNNLPSVVGESNQISLEEMLDSKLVEDIIDENGNSCSGTDSYVQVTKTVDNEYAMKVYLSCDDKTDYIVTTISNSIVCKDCESDLDNEETTTTTTSVNKLSDSSSVYTTQPTSTGYAAKSSTTTTTNIVTKTINNITNYNINYVNNCSKCSDTVCKSSCLSTVYYSVYFDANGGSAVARQIVKKGETAIYKSSSRNGYKFVGWYLDGAKYDFDTPVTKTITLVAKWQKVTEDINNIYTVTFVPNGGSSVPSQSVEEGDLAYRPSNPTKSCYDFAGWYTDKALTHKYDFNTPVTSNVTLYAKWVENDSCKNDYTVRFVSNGGSSVPSQTVEEGDTATKPSNPTRTCYDFAGWYTDKALTNKYNFSTPVTQDITLYAKWVENDSCKNDYTVRFVSNGGSSVPSQTVEEGDTATKPSNPTRSGYTFIGWYTTSSLTKLYNFSTPVTSDITLYAKWEKNVEKYYTYCKVEEKTIYSISYTDYKANFSPYTYGWTIKFHNLSNVQNLKITNTGYISDYNEALNQYVANQGISMVNGSTGIGISSGTMLETYSLKSNNFTKSMTAPYKSGGYWYTDVTIYVKNYTGATKYQKSTNSYVYFVPFYFDLQYTDLNNCVDDKASNSSRYSNYEIVDTYYE